MANRIEELICSKQMYMVKTELERMQAVDIAEIISEMDGKTGLLVFRLLPKEVAAEVFSYMSGARQLELSALVKEDELKAIIDVLYFDDMIDYTTVVDAVALLAYFKIAALIIGID